MTDTAPTSQLLHPGEEAYDTARALWNGMIDKRPATIARASSVNDVIAAVNHARQNDLRVTARGGGHGVAGNALNDGGLVVDLSHMKRIDVDAVDPGRAERHLRLGRVPPAPRESARGSRAGEGVRAGGGLAGRRRNQR